MDNSYPARYLEKVYRRHFLYKRKRWRDDIFQVMWGSLYESLEGYRRCRCRCNFEDYAEMLIVKKVKDWIRDNYYFGYRYLSLDKPFTDSRETMLSTYIAADDAFCPLELYDFISRLCFVKYAVCKGYILRYHDEEIADMLHLSREQLEDIKMELRQDFTVGYLI